MIAGALNFTLGLQANQFLNSLGASSGKLLGLLGAANAIQSAFGKMWGAVEQGGKLKDVAAAASLSVKDLYQLQQAFTNVGASAESVPAVINKLRRTLAGGEQNNLITQLGLDPATLGRMNPAEQFSQVAAALAKINVNARAGAAQALFGREGAQTIQQIANSGNDFAGAMQRAAADAEVWQKTSATFDDIQDRLTELQAHVNTLWATLAGALIQAFNEGRLDEVITDILVTGIQAGLALIPAMFVKLGEILLRVFQTPLAYLQAGIEFAIDQAVNNPKVRALLKLTPAGGLAIAGLDALGVTSGQPSSFQDILNERLAEGVKFNLGTGEFGINDISESANGLLSESLAKSGGLLGGLQERLGELVSRLPQGNGAAAVATTESFEAGKTKAAFAATEIEKMGGTIFGLGRGFGGGDDARQTTTNTKKTADILATHTAILKDIAPALKLVGINI